VAATSKASALSSGETSWYTTGNCDLPAVEIADRGKLWEGDVLGPWTAMRISFSSVGTVRSLHTTTMSFVLLSLGEQAPAMQDISASMHSARRIAT